MVYSAIFVYQLVICEFEQIETNLSSLRWDVICWAECEYTKNPPPQLKLLIFG